MKPTLSLLLLFVAALSFAQTDSVETRFATATQSTVITLNRAEIERLPATSFLELVAGAFPFLGAEGIEEEFTYVVNGFVQMAPNAINLSQLESIAFYSGGTPLTSGSLGKRGTFIISTKPTANRFSASTKTGLWSVKNDELPSSKLSGLHHGFFSLNEVSVQRKTEKAFVSGAASFLHDRSPDYLYTFANQTYTNSHTFNRLRASMFGGYNLSKVTEIEGGLFYTLQPQNFKDDYKPTTGNNVSYFQSTDNKTTYMGAHAGLRFTPSTKLTNFFTAEFTRAKETLNGAGQSLATGLPTYFSNNKGDARFTAFAFSNRVQWTPVNTSAINLQASLLARYRLYKSGSEYATAQSSGTNQQVGFSNAAQKTNNHSLSISPSLTLRFKEWLTVQAGITYEGYVVASSIFRPKNWLPDAGLKINLAPLAKRSGLTLLEISSSYRQQIRASERGDLLEANNSIRPYLIGIGNGNTGTDYTPRKNWVTSFALGILQNRLAAKVSYRILDRMLWAEVPVPYPSGTYYRDVFEPLRSKGWSVELKAAIVENATAKWTNQLTLYKEDYEQMQHGNGVYSLPIDPVLFDAGKAPLRGGFRTTLDVRRFLLQASLLLSFNEQGTNDNGITVDDMTKFNTAFLLAGYRLPLKGKTVKGFEVNLQSRNLFSTKHDITARYAGIGVSANF